MNKMYRTIQYDEPTKRQYEAYLNIFNYLNQKLFDKKLPSIILNFSRDIKNVYGFFAPERWVSNDKKIHELSLNPRSIACLDAKEAIQTIVHEMVHLWQYEYGNPSRPGYHNKEWAQKMESIGLMPSQTGKPGGLKIGQKMADYIVPGGKLDLIIKEIPNEYLLPWVSIEAIENLKLDQGRVEFVTSFLDNVKNFQIEVANEESGEIDSIRTVNTSVRIDNQVLANIQQAPIKYNKSKTKYVCNSCKAAVWGKPGLNIICGECEDQFDEI